MDGDFPTKVYTPPLASWSTSCMGVLLGYIYYRYKKTIDIKITWKLNTVWLLTVISLPLVILYVASRSYEGIAKIILAATLKPMFVLPFCLGFLGMAFGFGGVLKAFLESKILVILANVSYCTYVFHIFVLGVKGFFSFGLLHYEPQYMAVWIIFDIVVSFAFGTVCTLLFEYPGLALQKKYLPQIKKPKKIEKKIEVNGTNPV